MAPMSGLGGAGSALADVGTDNPSLAPSIEQTGDRPGVRFGLSEEDIAQTVKIITAYRGQWAPDRLMRVPGWMKNTLMYRGSQVLAWDENTGTYFDALAWARQGGDEVSAGDAAYLQKFICNITQMFGVGFKGMMSRGVPQTVVRPENAEILADVTTAKAAQEAISIIERMNKIRQMVREEYETMYLMGSYFKHTRGVLDGNWAGYDEEEVYGDVPVTRPDRYHCFGCGTDTPVDQSGAVQMGPGVTVQKPLRQCPQCKKRLGPESFYPGSTSMEMSVTGRKKIPRAMVKQTVHSPMEVDVDPQAKDLTGTPLLALDLEIDVGEARLMFPQQAKDGKIVESLGLGTTPNAEYEKQRRAEIQAYVNGGGASGGGMQRPTYSQNWLQPAAYYQDGDLDYAARMMAVYPEGLKLTLLGPETVDVRAAVLVKEWTACQLHEGFGLYSPSVADNVVPFNERFNNTMQQIDEWVETCANGLNVVDGNRIDKREMSGKAMRSGELNELPMKVHGESQPLSNAFVHFDMPMEARVFEYPQMLLQFCQLIACLPPQSTGAGTLPGVDTARGQKQMLDIASNALNIYWENGKEEHAAAAQNAIECLQKLLKAGAVEQIWDVVQDQGSQFRNNYVNLAKMKGRVNVYADVDQGLPQSPEAIREVFTSILQQAGEGSPYAQAVLNIPTNREQVMQSLGTPDLVVPLAAQQAKTEQAINVLLEQDWQETMGPDGQVAKGLPVMPDKYVEDFPTLKDVMRLFRQENSDLARSNPGGWARLDAYYQMAEEMEMEVAVEDAQRKQEVSAAMAPAPPPPAQPDPTIESAKQDLLRSAQGSIDRLKEIEALPPLGKNASVSGQVTAASEILNTALKVAQASADGAGK